MTLNLVFLIGLTFGARDGAALQLFPKPARVMRMRSARVDDTSFVVLNGKLYRQDAGDGLAIVSRWPHVSKIAKFGNALVALSYAGELAAWTRSNDGSWTAKPLSPRAFLDFSANSETLVAVDRDGHAHVAHPGVVAAPAGDSALQPVLPELGDLNAVAGYSPGRGFAIWRRDSSRVLLDPSGSPCSRLLGLK